MVLSRTFGTSLRAKRDYAMLAIAVWMWPTEIGTGWTRDG